MTDRVSFWVPPPAFDATIVTDQRPLPSSYGVLNVPSDPTGRVTGAGVVGGFAVGDGVLPGFGVGAGVPALPRYVALTTTWVAFAGAAWAWISPGWRNMWTSSRP